MNLLQPYHQEIVLISIVFLIYGLYKELVKPAILFLYISVFYTIIGIITTKELVAGFANEQIISIFLLIFITSSLRHHFPVELWLDKLYRKAKTKTAFLWQMMMSISLLSSVVNNTPLVAVMTPYVHSWGKRNHVAPSKLLIPLSFATILGGMMSVIGTSTNLVLDGFIRQNHATPLKFTDFLYLGALLTVCGVAFLATIGQKLLPNHPDALDTIKNQTREYVVETVVQPHSKLIGKSIAQANLRNLRGVFLAELLRGNTRISPVSPEEVLQPHDILIFAGNTETIIDLINEDNGLELPTKTSAHLKNADGICEAVVPANSSLTGKTVKETNFRKRFDAAILAIHRNGEKLKEKIGQIRLMPGDLLLLTIGKNFKANAAASQDIYVVNQLETPKKQVNLLKSRITLLLFAIVIGCLISGSISLFKGLLLLTAGLFALGLLQIEDLKRETDFNLVIILVCALAVGTALVNSGAAQNVASFVITQIGKFGTKGIVIALFVVTVLLTSFITNAAAVSIVFPIAQALSNDLQIQSPALYVTIAYAASAAFLTPVGYQTNLIIYGPGGYEFKDFFRIGIPFTLLYTTISVAFIIFYYGL
ncbi:MAG: SLC13 family permease [Cytophagales bacterium]|nr:SLC13 family permease [Cytophagales bacterium]MDW8384647.1 SLC13 family permease [Flammeovirgaceae bacterium]